MIASMSSGEGRYTHGSCGGFVTFGADGIAYCSGENYEGWNFGNHLASFYSSDDPSNPYIGCAGTGCNGPDCDLQVWVWLVP
jgi:hypothetical protein